MTISDVVMIIAVLLAPFLAVFTQKRIEVWREKRDRKIWIFKTLMATRGRVLSLEHVQALNMIQLEFTGPNDKDVKNAWGGYHDHLNSYPREGSDLEHRRTLWGQRSEDLFAELLLSMGKELGYDFNKVQIVKGAYSPEGHATTEMELNLIRKMILEWLGGTRRVNVSILPSTEEDAAQGMKVSAGILGIIDGRNELKVKIIQDTDTVDPESSQV